MSTPKEYYKGREQAFLKHTILKTYIERLFYIVGQGCEPVINYVDGFAGPWSEGDGDLSDTSIGISIDKIKKCANTLKANHNREVKFRALYVEKDPDAFRKLKKYIDKQNHPLLELHCIHGDFVQSLPEIANWTQQLFTFFFIDPKGWKGIVGPKTLDPILRLPRAEFLVNLMYDFANRAVNIEKHEDDIQDLVGEKLLLTGDESSWDRQNIMLNAYRSNIKSIIDVSKKSRTRSAYVPIFRPGTDRVLYFLVYFTNHARGISVFKEESEKMEFTQKMQNHEVRLRNKNESSGIEDMFGIERELLSDMDSNNKLSAKKFIESELSSGVKLICHDYWADMLERSDLYPRDLQLAMKELFSEGKVINLDGNVKPRRTKIIRPNWKNKSERWELV